MNITALEFKKLYKRLGFTHVTLVKELENHENLACGIDSIKSFSCGRIKVPVKLYLKLKQWEKEEIRLGFLE